MKDDTHKTIKVGDILRSKWGYRVIVKYNSDLGFYGKLICDKNHPCAKIPYHLNNGKGHIIINVKK
jgi:hypothetical protein